MVPLCMECKHLDPAERDAGESDPVVFYCKAFPFGGPGIPAEIIRGEVSHEGTPYPGDNGIRFEPIEFGDS